MDKKHGILNVIVSIAFKIIILICLLLIRRLIINYIGNEINGLNSLYSSILGFLAVAELGVGSAITFCMYKPIVEGDNKKVSALYHLFSRLYLLIGAIVFVCGCILLPFLKYFVKDYATLGQNVNLYLTFFLTLIATVLTYAFSAKTSLINAYKNNYITTTITSLCLLLQYVAQIFVIKYTQSFVWYLVCAIVSVILQWGITEIVTRRKYGNIISEKQKVDLETKNELVKNIKAMFMHKIGNLLVNTADSVIISAFISVVTLGKYSNYATIVASMSGVITLFFTPLTSVIGHLYVEESGESLKKYYHFFHTFNFIVGTVFFLGYYGVIDNLVTICFDKKLTGDLIMTKSVSFVITLNYFIQFMRQATLLFRDATGTFYNDRWKPFVEGVINVILSIVFVVLLKNISEEIGVVGVIVATILTNIFICHIVEPHVLYKYALHDGAKRYYIKNYLYIALFACALVALHFCTVTIGGESITMKGEILELLANGLIAVAVAVPPCLIAIFSDGDFRHYLGKIFGKIKHKLCKHKESEKN